MLADTTVQTVADQVRDYDFVMVLGVLTEIVCAGCLLFRRVYRSLPFLCAFIGFMSLADAIGVAVYLKGTAENYREIFYSATALQYVLEAAIVGELCLLLNKVARPFIPKKTMVFGILGIWSVFLVIALSLTTFVVYRNLAPDMSAYLQVDLGFCVLRALAFAFILSMTQICGVRWNSLITQVTAYLSLYYVVDLLCEVVHQMQARSIDPYWHFYTVEYVRVGAWCCAMVLISRYLISHPNYLLPKSRILQSIESVRSSMPQPRTVMNERHDVL